MENPITEPQPLAPVFSPDQIRTETSNFFRKVYAWMACGLLISAATAYWVASTPSLLELILGNRLVFYGLLIGELVLVFTLVAMIKKIPASLAIVLFVLYCVVTGLTLSVIFLVFQLSSIVSIFWITAGMFASMSLFGFLTKRDLTSLGHVLIMGLFGIIIAMVANFFLHSAQLDYILSAIGVVVFTGLTAYDTQKIKNTNVIGNEGTEEDTKEAIIGALTLYLDFVNLFLDLLRLFGRRR